MTQKSFAASEEHRFRRDLRQAVRKSNLTRAEKDVVTAFINHWFAHRAKGAVHPGRKRLAKVSGASVRSVNYTLGMLRDFEAIAAVAYASGNGSGEWNMATDYTVNVKRLLALCDLPKKALVAFRKSAKAGNIGVQKCTLSGGAKNAPRSSDGNVVVFRRQGEVF